MKKLNYLLFTIAGILMITGCGMQNTDLTCTRVFGENNKHVLKYSFEDGKAYVFDETFTTPATGIENETTYEKEFNKINAVTGCTSSFIKNDDGSYTSQQVCNLSEMSDSDIKAVYNITREDLESTGKEIIKHFKYDEDMKCE